MAGLTRTVSDGGVYAGPQSSRDDHVWPLGSSLPDWLNRFSPVRVMRTSARSDSVDSGEVRATALKDSFGAQR
jgi:hypothetical protein